MILEATDNLLGEVMYTVRSNRGTEYIINTDRAACAIANALADIAHEERMGWTLEPQYYRELLNNIISASKAKA